MVTLSKSLKYPQMRCKSSPTSTIPTALRFFRCPVRCEKLRLLGAGGQGRPDTPSGCFQGLEFFSEPIVMAEAEIHSNVVICQVPYHTCMAYLPTCAIWWIFMVHVGKYTSTMDSLGSKLFIDYGNYKIYISSWDLLWNSVTKQSGESSKTHNVLGRPLFFRFCHVAFVFYSKTVNTY